MLDENLPTFLLKASKDKPKHGSTFLYSQYGADFEPMYGLKHPDPQQHASRNRYAAGLYDAFNADVLFAEVLLIPEWTQPTSNPEEIRRNGGVPPPPEPILPSEFVIQLYNPDQQVTVRHKSGGLTTAPSWEFELPQQTFRAPSSSTLDRSQHDPGASDLTPKIGFKWKRDGKFSKDLVCFLDGRSLNPDGTRRKHKEPDITVSIFKGLKEVTLYEPNLQRVEVEDIKGLEVVLLLGAVVIKDVYFSPALKETFNLSEVGRRPSNPISPRLNSQSSVADAQPANPSRPPRVPPTDPRSQWEIDAETERLRREAEEEERLHRRTLEQERKQIKKMVEAEEREQQIRQVEIDRETERLRRMYGQEDSSARPPISPRPDVYAPPPWQSAYGENSYSNNPYPQAPYMSGAAAAAAPSSEHLRPGSEQRLRNKTSFFGFRRHSDQDGGHLTKKSSAMF